MAGCGCRYKYNVEVLFMPPEIKVEYEKLINIKNCSVLSRLSTDTS